MSSEGKNLVMHAVLGFDERPILHCIVEAEKRGWRVSKLVLYLADTGDPYGEERSKKALETLRYLLRNAEIEVVKLKPTDILRNIFRVASKLVEHEDEGDIMVSVSTGMRPLLLSLYTAVLSLYQARGGKKIILCIEPEGQQHELTLLELDKVLKAAEILAKRGEPVDWARRAIEVVELLEREPKGLTLAQLLSRISIPKSSLYKLLERMVQAGILAKDEKTKRYMLMFPGKGTNRA